MKKDPAPSFEYDPEKDKITRDSRPAEPADADVLDLSNQPTEGKSVASEGTEQVDNPVISSTEHSLPTKAKKLSRRQQKKLNKAKGKMAPAQADTSNMSKDFADLYKPKKRRWPKVLLVLFLLLLAAAGAFGYYVYTHAAKFSTNPFDFSSKLKGEDTGRVNIMVLGVGDPGHAGESLADTNMIISINTKTKPAEVVMLGIPRDTRVEIPTEGYNKINDAHAVGEAKKPPQGIELSEKTIEKNFGIPINYYVRANFTGLKQAVDAVGGIDINVKEALNDPEYPCDNNQNRSCGFKLAAGQQHMNGTVALKYARCRKGNCGDDFGRSLRQQEVLTAIREKALSSDTLSNPTAVNNLISAASNNIKTDLSLRNIQRLAELTQGLNSSDISNVVLSLKPNGFLVSSKTSSDLVPKDNSFSEIQRFLNNIFVLAPIMKEEPTLSILNGSTKPNLATKLKTRLEDEAVPIYSYLTGNAKVTTHTTSTIVDYTGGKKPKTSQYLAKLLGVTVTQPEKPVKNPVVDFEITLGSEYANTVSGSSN